MICNMDYVHLPELAPTQDILDEYQKNKGDWAVCQRKFLELMRIRELCGPAVVLTTKNNAEGGWASDFALRLQDRHHSTPKRVR